MAAELPRIENYASRSHIDHPPYLGTPMEHRYKAGNVDVVYRVFDKLSASEYYNIVPLKIDHYEMFAILENGDRIEVEVRELGKISLKENLVQRSINERFCGINDCYREWLKILVPGTRQKPSDDYFLILLHRIPGLTSSKFSNGMGDGYWCPRLPSEEETKSMLVHLERFELCLCEIVAV